MHPQDISSYLREVAGIRRHAYTGAIYLKLPVSGYRNSLVSKKSLGHMFRRRMHGVQDIKLAGEIKFHSLEGVRYTCGGTLLQDRTTMTCTT